MQNENVLFTILELMKIIKKFSPKMIKNQFLFACKTLLGREVQL